MKKIFSVLVVGVFLLCATLAFAGTSVTFEWDANDVSEGITGYRLYQSSVSSGYTFGDGSQVATILEGTETVVLPNLLSGVYFWVLTAYRVNGIDLNGDPIIFESFPSNEVTATLDTLAPSVPSNLRITIKVIVDVEHP